MQFIQSTSTKLKSGLVNVSNLDQDTKILLKLRSSTDVGESGTLCLHHQQLLIHKYEFLQKYCADPHKMHRKKISKHLKILMVSDVEKMNKLDGIYLIPGQKLCFNCFSKLSSEAAIVKTNKPHNSESESVHEAGNQVDDAFSSSGEFVCTEYDEDVLNKSFENLGVSPLKPSRVSAQNKPSYGKRKMTEVSSAVSKTFQST